MIVARADLTEAIDFVRVGFRRASFFIHNRAVTVVRAGVVALPDMRAAVHGKILPRTADFARVGGIGDGDERENREKKKDVLHKAPY